MSSITFNYGYNEFWSVYDPANGQYGNQKVAFDGLNKRIIVHEGITDIDVKQDIYSNWKEWMQVRDNAKYLPAIRTTGGDPTSGGQFTGDTYFLINDWQIVINQLVQLNGILYHDNPALSPYIINSGGGVIATVSSLSQSVSTSSGALTPEQAAQLDLIEQVLRAAKQSVSLSA
tara:strand:+ start:5562 stop:6083 length:522 start_codon:yes stop_codon:yes gene_type:complete